MAVTIPKYTVGRVTSKRWTILKDGKMIQDYVNTKEDAEAFVVTVTNEVNLIAQQIPAPTPTPDPTPDPTPVPDPAPTGTPLQKFLGPVLPASKIATLGPSYQKYLTDFVAHHARQWDAAVASAVSDPAQLWAQLNYYDRAHILYAWAEMTGETKYRDQARALALNYRTSYLEPNKYGSSAHWSMMKGIAAHFLDTGDEASKLAVEQVAINISPVKVPWGNGFSWYANSIKDKTGDGRIAARMLENSHLAAKLGVPNTGTAAGGMPAPADGWVANTAQCVDLILAAQDADGGFRFSPEAYQVKPAFVGLINNALIDYHRDYDTHDAKILDSIKRSCDFMWANCWDAATNSFQYVDNATPTEGDGPSPDLNGLIVEGYAWLFKQTGDTSYRTKALSIMEGGISGAWVGGTKQFNQHYTSWSALPFIFA